MEAILFCFFDKVFSDLDRGCLLARYKRRELVEYFNTVIQGVSAGDDSFDTQSACRQTVQATLDFHRSARQGNSDLCLLGKYHNILYVAAKLCFDWKLEDNETVCRLLRDIYQCERTFERLMVGAIFGTRVTHLISGWKSDFADRNECLRAIEYFLDHAARGNLMFSVCGHREGHVPMAQVPMESYGQALPTKVCVQAGRADVLQVLVKYGGAIVASDTMIPHSVMTASSLQPQYCGLQLLLRHLQDIAECGNPLPCEMLQCLNVYLTYLPRVPSIFDQQLSTDEEQPIIDVHPAILAAIPLEKTGYHPNPLKHLCRCVIYYRLATNGQMPYGVSKLGLPPSLQNYVNT